MTINSIADSNGKAAQNRRAGSKRRTLSLRNRLLITFILLASLPVLLTGIVSGLINAQGLRAAAFDQLASVAQLKTNEINSWIDALQVNLGLVMQDRISLSYTNTILQGTANSTMTESLRNKLNALKKSIGYFDEIFIMDINGNILVSTDKAQEGKIAKNQSYFQEGAKGNYVAPPAYDVALSSYSIVFSQPIQYQHGQTIGVIAGRANLTVLDQIMAEQTGLGETGETYLVGGNYALLSKLRFGDTKIGETYIRSTGTTNAIGQKSTGSELYNDYRGSSVLGAHQWIPELQVALIAEHDEGEALQASNQAFNITLGLMVLTVLIAGVAAFLVTRSIVNPISQLVSISESISAGNLEINAQVDREDEIGVLATSFNTMTLRLRELINTLETRVADRTKALATTSQVSRRLSTILNQKELVTEVVNQVNNAFGYYNTQIYFLDADKENLVMAGGTGLAGETMLASGHKIAKGRGLVGRAAENNAPVLVSNTTLDENWLPNPLLPETKSEVAIPITLGDEVLGVLDVQQNIADALKEDDVTSLQSIANQVAVAYQNIRQYENSQKVANDLSVVANVGIATATITDIGELLQEVVDLSKKSFNLYHAHIYMLNEAGDALELTAGAGEVGRKMTSEGRKIQMDTEQSLVVRAARSQQGVVANDVAADPNFLPNPLLPETRAEMAVPMIASGKVIGVLDVQSETVGRFTDVDVNIKTTLASQIAVAVQNARNFERSKKQAEREAAVNLIAQRIQGTTSIENALQMAARELGHALGMKQTSVSLEPEKANERTGSNNE